MIKMSSFDKNLNTFENITKNIKFMPLKLKLVMKSITQNLTLNILYYVIILQYFLIYIILIC